MNDTIVAIATAKGKGAVSIVRVSGKKAINIVNNITKAKNLPKVNTHTINYDFIVDGEELIDEVLISVMKAPKTFTKEDVVEINTHASIAILNKVLELLIRNGCRLAEPGEFTKRAFLNGRIDLIEAEGIMDLVNSKTEKARKMAINQLGGKTSNMIRELREMIVSVLANIEVNIDYPEYEDIKEITISDLTPKIKIIKSKIEKILKESTNGIMIKEGLTTAIIGKPNVGKSSLLNCLLEQNKAIVTEIEGTTRDIVEGTISINGIILNILDTAGIRKTDNLIEKYGVDKSYETISKADLILYVVDNNKSITKTDYELLETIKNKTHIVVINKIDLTTNIDLNKLNDHYTVKISTLKNEGINELKEKIIEIFNLEELEAEDLTYLTNADALSKLKEVLNRIEDINKAIVQKLPIDMIEIDVKKIWTSLGEILGETYEDELIDKLFSQFCLGK